MAAAGEVRVKVRASSLNGFDNVVVSGYAAALMEHRFPVVLGRDFAGTIDQVGDGVTGHGLGDEVFGVVLTMPLHAGGFGEYVVVPQASLARVPSGLDLATAGAMGLAGSAATTVLDTVDPKPGETILICGATGGVGNMLIQLAKARGATVLATAAPGAEAELVQRLGAAHLIDHTGDVAAQVRQVAPGGVDIAVHLAGDPFAVADLVAPGGRFATLLGVGQDQMGERDIVAHSVMASLRPAPLEELAWRVVAGELVVPIQRTYQLDEVPQAFADFNTGTLGKLAITIA
jgi:NADPH:quinone reductase-like Zn-dependent oxidoreductase